MQAVFFFGPNPAEFMALSSLYTITRLAFDSIAFGVRHENSRYKYAMKGLLFLKLWFAATIQNEKGPCHELIIG